MKIQGQAFITKNFRTITLNRPDGNGGLLAINLKVGPLPLGWRERLISKGIAETAQAPVKPLKDGDVFRKDENGHALVYRDTRDLGYVNAQNLMTRRFEALCLVEHLRDDAAISFDATEPAADAPIAEFLAFADKIIAELAESSLTDAEIGSILEVGSEVANAINTKAVVASFLSPEDSRPAAK